MNSETLKPITDGQRAKLLQLPTTSKEVRCANEIRKHLLPLTPKQRELVFIMLQDILTE